MLHVLQFFHCFTQRNYIIHILMNFDQFVCVWYNTYILQKGAGSGLSSPSSLDKVSHLVLFSLRVRLRFHVSYQAYV